MPSARFSTASHYGKEEPFSDCNHHYIHPLGPVQEQASFCLFPRLPNTDKHSRRHGWGCTPNQEQAVHYLSMAASNSAEIERLALDAGMKKGGVAKGELVLAIFELANCFRHGWGVKKDAAAAKQYYETAANLGDTDAMNEVACCYVEGFGTKKDKVSGRSLSVCLSVRACFPVCPTRRRAATVMGREKKIPCKWIDTFSPAMFSFPRYFLYSVYTTVRLTCWASFSTHSTQQDQQCPAGRLTGWLTSISDTVLLTALLFLVQSGSVLALGGIKGCQDVGEYVVRCSFSLLSLLVFFRVPASIFIFRLSVN